MRRCGVEQDECGVSEKRPGGERDDGDQQQGQGRVQVVLVAPVCQPDHTGTEGVSAHIEGLETPKSHVDIGEVF